jgi:hypothetical protein
MPGLPEACEQGLGGRNKMVFDLARPDRYTNALRWLFTFKVFTSAPTKETHTISNTPKFTRVSN